MVEPREETMTETETASLIGPPNGKMKRTGKEYYRVWQSVFEVDDKYVPMKPIGRGSYGVVCSALNRLTGEKLAVKKIGNAFDNVTDARRTLREIKILSRVSHQNIVALRDIMLPEWRYSFKDVYLVYELMDTDLGQIIRSPQPLSTHHCKYFMFQMLNGLNYLHSANILHRDLKPGNLLVNADCSLKICDFGLARTGKERTDQVGLMTEYVVTRWYRAPELLLGCDNYDASVDVWSIGCIFAEILGRKPFLPGANSLNQLSMIVDVIGSPTEAELDFVFRPKMRKYIDSLPFSHGAHLSRLFPNADPLALDLLQRMLAFNPTTRITVAEALRHPYISDIYEPRRDSLRPWLQAGVDVNEKYGERGIRDMMWHEILRYHPEATR